MKKLFFLLILAAMLIAGCRGEKNYMTCQQYCEQQEHADCAGEWQVLGEYPDCTCNFVCPEHPTAAPETKPAEIQKPNCTNECDSGQCVGTKYYDCVLKQDGCKSKVEWKVRKGTCGVECITNADCSGNDCVAYKCKTPVSTLNLNKLPKPFSDDAIIIVGGNAPASDVAAAGKVSAMLVYEGGKPFDTKLDNQVTTADYNHNLILLGNPCHNAIVERVFGIVCNGTELTSSQALLKLAESNGKTALLISGGSPSATLKAAEKVANYASSGLSGTEMVINV